MRSRSFVWTNSARLYINKFMSRLWQARPGKVLREDYHYRRKGVCQVFMPFEPLAGIRYVKLFRQKRGEEFAKFLKLLATKYYADRDKILLVMDNYSTHKLKFLYEYYPASEARALVAKFEVYWTPVHASWLNPVEPELSILSRQCLNRRFPDFETVVNEVSKWEAERNQAGHRFHWKFQVSDARRKLASIYPVIQTK